VADAEGVRMHEWTFGIQDVFGSFGVHQKNSPAGARPGCVPVHRINDNEHSSAQDPAGPQ
jgi:hypothetical protein